MSNIGKVGLLLHDEPDKGASAGTFWLNAGTKAAPDWQLQNPSQRAWKFLRPCCRSNSATVELGGQQRGL